MKIGDLEIEVVVRDDLPEGVMAVLLSPPVAEFTVVFGPRDEGEIDIDIEERWFPERACVIKKGTP